VTKTYFSFRVDVWDEAGDSIVEHVARIDDFETAMATYWGAIQRWPKAKITLLARARAEMDDEEKARHERLLKEQKELQESLEHSRERVGVRADDLQRVVGAALARAGSSLAKARAETVGDVTTFNLDPAQGGSSRLSDERSPPYPPHKVGRLTRPGCSTPTADRRSSAMPLSIPGGNGEAPLARPGHALAKRMRLAEGHRARQRDSRDRITGLRLAATTVRAIPTPSPGQRKGGSISASPAKRPLGCSERCIRNLAARQR
jgi:hypothetical protein